MTQLSLDLSDELDYQLVISKRAKRLTLRIVAGRGLVVTVPKRFPKRDVPAFVEKNRSWIESTLADVERQTPELYRQWPPRRLELCALNQIMYLDYADDECVADALAGPGSHATGDAAVTTRLRIQAEPSCRQSVACEIAKGLRLAAEQTLPERLAAHARRHGMKYKRVQIRGQRTLWGSYSSSGTLSLNYKLLFLSPGLLDYVMLHELAHTRCLDHSPRFWRELEVMQPEARQLDAQLAQAGRLVPPWLELAR